MINESPFVTISEVATRWGCHRMTARSRLRRLQVPIFKPTDRQVLVKLVDLERAERRATTVEVRDGK